MKNIKHLILAIASTLLLTAGLSQAAEHLDPVSHSTANHQIQKSNTDVRPANGCTLSCIFH